MSGISIDSNPKMDASKDILLIDLAETAIRKGIFEQKNSLGWVYIDRQPSDRLLAVIEPGDLTKMGNYILFVADVTNSRQKAIALWLAHPICPICKSSAILSQKANDWQIDCCGQTASGDLKKIERRWRTFSPRPDRINSSLYGHLPGVFSNQPLEKHISELRCSADIPKDTITRLVSSFEHFEEQAIRLGDLQGRALNTAVNEAAEELLNISENLPKWVFLSTLIRSQTIEMEAHHGTCKSYFASLLSILTKFDLQLSPDDLIDLLRWGFTPLRVFYNSKADTSNLSALMVESLQGKKTPNEVAFKIEAFKEFIESNTYFAEDKRGRETIKNIDICLNLREKHCVKVVDTWTYTFNQATDAEAWKPLVALAASATSSSPTQKFLRETSKEIAILGQEHFLSVMTSVLSSMGKPSPLEEHDRSTIIDPREIQILRGLIFSCAPFLKNDLTLLPLLIEGAKFCYEKTPSLGYRAVSVGNAIVYVISQNPEYPAKRDLYEIQTEVDHISSWKVIQKAIDRY